MAHTKENAMLNLPATSRTIGSEIAIRKRRENSRMRSAVLATVAATVALQAPVQSFADVCPPPWCQTPPHDLFFDFDLFTDMGHCPIIPVPVTPSVNTDAQVANAFECLWTTDQSLPLVVNIAVGTSGIPGWQPYLENALDAADQYAGIAFVFDDFELGIVPDPDVVEKTSIVRQHFNCATGVRIGSYLHFPGKIDKAYPRRSNQCRSDWDAFYHLPATINGGVECEGLNVAMPVAFPYEYYAEHTVPVCPCQIPGNCPECEDPVGSPNDRASLFWAPLERVSLAKRCLPEGHLLIPYIAPFVPNGCLDRDDRPIPCTNLCGVSYTAAVPPLTDAFHLVQHFRLRGASGFYNLGNGAGGISAEAYRTAVTTAWNCPALEAVLEGTALDSPLFLNLKTSKSTGVQRSGTLRGNKVVFLISNLSDSCQRVRIGGTVQGLPQEMNMDLPTWSPAVAAGTHLLLTYDLSECPFPCQIQELSWELSEDITGDETVNIDDLFTVIGQWGPCGADYGPCSTYFCEADIVMDGDVNIDDLFAVIGNWGGSMLEVVPSQDCTSPAPPLCEMP
jgi:hypothetical protein